MTGDYKQCPGFPIGACDRVPAQDKAWCAVCEQKRIAHIDKQFERLENLLSRKDK